MLCCLSPWQSASHHHRTSVNERSTSVCRERCSSGTAAYNQQQQLYSVKRKKRGQCHDAGRRLRKRPSPAVGRLEVLPGHRSGERRDATLLLSSLSGRNLRLGFEAYCRDEETGTDEGGC